MNPSTKKIQTKLALIRLLKENRRMSLEELSKYSGIRNIDLLKKELGKLYMVGTYPYSPDQLVEIDYDGETIGIRLPVRMDDGFSLSVREWATLRALILEELESEGLQKENPVLKQILNKIHTILPVSGLPETKQIHQILSKAILDRKSLQMEYQAQGEKNAISRKVDPWAIFHFQDDYLIGYCHFRKAPRTFRLDAILSLKESDESCVNIPDSEKTAAIHYMKDFLKSPSGDASKAEIFHTGESYFNLHKRFGLERTSESRVFEGTRYFLSKAKIRNEEWFVSVLKGFGPSVIVKSPISLRNRLSETWQTLMEEEAN
ncbi:transcriptional regulator [Leptospira perolatii]|uniref:Transcriptional regulator n=1 Tax=Leptospira perolatii TaxID=2023191 RepID=A0A2M9ZLL5_9LEPT|nr:WYL domain-containing protein [Leptospira perolatii]PJZ69805.1 transcriptional regulator [Leptospira perolatii]PJZ72980.1 transcriptional regulator [Leptospira perolatii]